MEKQVNTSVVVNKLPALIPGYGEFTIFIPKNVQDKIDYVCNRVHNTEWSGTLFYTVEGTMETKDFIVKAVDIFVQDIGSTTYTEFSQSPDLIGYITEHMELMEDGIYNGLLHSHHSMSTFFSGTDVNTLQEEGADINHFVSLIVNNTGPYSARVTRKVKSTRKISDSFTYSSFGGVQYIGKSDREEEVEEIEWFKLNILHEQVYKFDEVDNQLTNIKKIKDAEKAAATKLKASIVASNSIPKVYTAPVPYTEWNDPYQTQDYDSYLDEVRGDKISSIKENAFEIENDLVDTTGLTFDKSILNKIVKQLLSGDVLTEQYANPNFDVIWKTNKKRFEKRFEDFRDFKEWESFFVQNLIYEAVDPLLINLGEDTMWGICAKGVKGILLKLPKDIYINQFIKTLEPFIE